MKKILVLKWMALVPFLSFALPHNNAYFSCHMPTQVDTSQIEIADSKILILDNDSTVSIKVIDKITTDSLNNKGPKQYKNVDVEIVENDYGTKVIVHKEGDTVQHFEMSFDDFNADQDHTNTPQEKTITFNKKSKKSKFRGHWSGFEFGLNNYATNTHSLSLNENDAYLELNTSKSWNYNFNFAQVSLPIFRDRVGLVSGLGIEWSNYHFSNKNTIIKDHQNQTITAKDLSNLALKKNRFQSTYITTPILLEVQSSGKQGKRVAISGGLIAGLKIGAHTKYKTSDNKQKDKDDFYLNPFRYGFTARIHYDDLGLYFNYYNTPLFMNDRGPELYPFAAGLVLSFD